MSREHNVRLPRLRRVALERVPLAPVWQRKAASARFVSQDLPEIESSFAAADVEFKVFDSSAAAQHWARRVKAADPPGTAS